MIQDESRGDMTRFIDKAKSSVRVGPKATDLFGGKTPRLPNYGIKTGSRVAEVIIHHKGGEQAFFRVQRKQRENGEVSVIPLARKVGFSPPVVTILAKRPKRMTGENEFELYGKWFSMILRCFLCSLTHNPISHSEVGFCFVGGTHPNKSK
jgi:hypothetical protein